MTFIPASHRGAGLTRRAMRVGAAVAMAVAAMLLVATPAGAHTPKVKAYCDEEGTILEIKLDNYKAGGDNTLTVIADDKTIIDEEVFGTSFSDKWATFDPKVEHEFVVEVVAWDDPDGAKGWSISEKHVVQACVAAATTSQKAAPKPPPATTSPATTPGGANLGGAGPEDLAETGASILIPIMLGVLLLAGGGGLLFLVRRRGDSGA
jgi:LPXTG-motif cell wall-anchored protein